MAAAAWNSTRTRRPAASNSSSRAAPVAGQATVTGVAAVAGLRARRMSGREGGRASGTPSTGGVGRPKSSRLPPR